MGEVFHRIRCCGRVFTSDEWSKYVNECYKDKSKRIYTTFGKYTFNDNDVCITPDTNTLMVQSKSSYGYKISFRIAECGNGLWVFGLDIFTGDGGYCGGPSWTDDKEKGFQSERDCRIAACDSALSHLETMLRYRSGLESEEGLRGKNIQRLMEMVKEYKKGLSRPKIVQLSLCD